MICKSAIWIFIWMISALGLIGNTIAFCTFGKMGNPNASTILLRFLAFVDSCLLFLSMLKNYEPILFNVTVEVILPILYSIAHTATIWTPILVGLHRYIVVCRPLLAARLCTVRYARMLSICVLLLSVLVNFPQFFRREIQEAPSNRTDIYTQVTYHAVDTEMAHSPWYTIAYDKVCRIGLINYVIPVLIMLFITVRLRQSLYSSMQQRMQMREGQSHTKDDRGPDVMVIVILIVFMICHTGYPLGTILEYVLVNTSGGINFIGVYCAMLAAFKTFILINSSVNCLIYIKFNRRFRKTLCPCRRTVANQQKLRQRTPTTAQTESK